MRHLLAFAMSVLLASRALAAPVTVTTGEHPGFTRLVFDYGTMAEWQFGRSPDGYELQINGSKPAYDLRGVFRAIGTTRVAAIWSDPTTGNLRIGIACACHAIPFEFRPGVIVVDLRDGAPPKGSSFEIMLDGGPASTLQPRAIPRPKARPASIGQSYDWLAQTLRELPKSSQTAAHSVPSVSPKIDLTARLDPLREQILQQLSVGAAQGIITMARPGPAPQSDLPTEFASAQVLVGGNRGSLAEADRDPTGDLGEAGQTCISAETLNLANWGSDLPVARQWSFAMADMVGEFDRTDPAALSRAIRFQLFLGFGAEARMLITGFHIESEEAEIWATLGRIMDNEPAISLVFDGQISCDGPAALWAALAASEPLSPSANTAAIKLAFSNLPLHLRALVGPRIAQKFLNSGDEESARAIRDAIFRADPKATDATLAVMAAEVDERAGNPDAADRRLRKMADAGGTGAIDALAGLVESQAQRGLGAKPTDVATLEAALAEQPSGPSQDQLLSAIILGKAASGDAGGAFDMLTQMPSLEPILWQLLAKQGTDRQVLEIAVLTPDQMVVADASTAKRLAERLLDMGMAGPAARWSDTGDGAFAARLKLASGSPDLALTLAKGDDDQARAVQLAALNQLGDGRSAAKLLLAMGDDAAAQRALNRAGAWQDLAKGHTGPLAELAKSVTEVTAPKGETADDAAKDGELERSHALITNSASSRQLIEDILQAQPAT